MPRLGTGALGPAVVDPVSEDDFLHGLEAEMADRQELVWQVHAVLEAAWLTRLALR
jgi:hypothetical protein